MDLTRRANRPWTTGEHSIALCLLKDYNKSYGEIARILKRSYGAINSHMRLVIREYYFIKNYTVDEIMSKFNFTKRQSMEKTIATTTDKHLKYIRGNLYKSFSDFAVKMEIMDAEVLASRAQNSNGLRNY